MAAKNADMIKTISNLTNDDLVKELSFADGFDFQDEYGKDWYHHLKIEANLRGVANG